MDALKFFENVDELKNEFESLKQMKECFVNRKTKEILPIENAPGKDLSNFDFIREQPTELINELIEKKIKNVVQPIEKENQTKGKYVSDYPFGEVSLRRLKLKVVNIDLITSNKVLIDFKVVNKPYHAYNNERQSDFKDHIFRYMGTKTNAHLFETSLKIGDTVEPYMVTINDPVAVKKPLTYKVINFPIERFYMKKPGKQ